METKKGKYPVENEQMRETLVRLYDTLLNAYNTRPPEQVLAGVQTIEEELVPIERIIRDPRFKSIFEQETLDHLKEVKDFMRRIREEAGQ